MLKLNILQALCRFSKFLNTGIFVIKTKRLRFYYLLFMIVLFTSCLNDKADESSGPCNTTYFDENIKPIFIANCYDPAGDGACHSSANPGDFSITENIVAEVSEIKRRINLPLTHVDHMPKGRTLSSIDLQALNEWLDDGGNICN
jgi:hypothetical protein